VADRNSIAARENGPVDQQAALLRAFRTTQPDLEANRLGRLGPVQRRRTLRTLAAGGVFGLALSAWVLVATFNQARTPGVEAQNWIIPAVAGLAIAALTVSAIWATLRRMGRRVECLTGTVSLSLVSMGRGRVAARLQLAGRSFTLPRPPHASAGIIDAYRDLLTDGSYNGYVQGPRLLALEPVSVSVLDRAGVGMPGTVATVGNALARPRVTWFVKASVVFLLLVMLGMGAAGVFLLSVQFTGTAATATVTDCVQDPDSRYVTYDCTGTWVTGGSLVGGNGHVVVGTVQGVDNTDVGKTIAVRLSGGEAYAQSLVLPILLMGLGFPPAALIGFLLVRTRRRRR
jgi:hypothetical protein